jgi:hypothetical protein
VHGDKAAEKFMEERMYKPEQPLAYEYAGDVGNFLEKLETEYKIPPMLPEAVALQYLTGPATSQAMRTAGRGAEQVGRKLESAMEPVVKGALERGGLPREMVMAMGQGTQSNIMKREGGNWLNNLTDPSLERLKITTRANNDPAEALRQVRERFTPEAIEALPENSRPNVINSIAQLERDVALNNWIDSNLSRYVKNEMGTPSDPIRLLIEKREDEINAKFALDQQRAQRIADRAEAEPDPRRKANLTRQSAQMMEEAEMNRDMAMKHKSHLPPDLQNPDTMWTPEYLAETRKRQGFPEEETGKTKSSQMWEQMADETIYPANVGEIQRHPANMERRAEAYLKLADFEAKVDQKLRDKFLKAGVDEDVLNRYLQNTLVTEKADVVGESELGHKLFNDVGSLPSNLQFLDEARSKNPWISKLDPKDTVYSGNVGGLNFDHVLDVLKEDLAAGRIRPEQLNKMSMEQAVRRTAEYDLELAKKMNADRASARADLPVYKEYPEGYKWVQLNRPSDFAAESDAMGHSVRGYEPPRGHPDWTDASGDYGYSSYGLGGWDAIKSGDAKVYSLVDAKGEPHVTIEVGKNRNQLSRDDLLPYREAALEEAKKLPNGYTDYDLNDIEIRMARENLPPYIKQIKGKGNDRPIEKYDPFTQDFVKSNKWLYVDDLKNTGLYKADPDELGMYLPNDIELYNMPEKRSDMLKRAKEAGLFPEGQDYLTRAEWEDILRKQYQAENPPKPDVPPDLGGMKRGGKVSISNNPDTMMMELGNKRMKEGGSEDDTDLSKPFFGGAGTKKYAAAKKRAEAVEPVTERFPKTSAAVMGLMGTPPDEMGFSVLNPEYQEIMDVADPAFYAGTALGIAPLGKALNAPFAAIGKALDPAVGRFVTKTMERGGLGADILTDMGQGTRSYVHLPHTEKSPDPTVGTRYKRTDIGGLVPRKDLDIEKLDKSSVKVFPWDASDRNKLVTEVSDIPLTKPVLLEGGDNYMRDIKHVKKRIAGASNEGIANRIQDRIDQASVENQILGGTGKVFGFPIRMADKAEHASTFPTDIAMDLLKQGNLSRKELDDLTNELRGMSFEAKGKGYFQNVAPIDSPEFLVQLREGIKGNKEKGITSVTDMNLRRALMDRLSQKKFQKRLEYNYPDLIGSVIADELKGVPKGWVGNVSAELDPFSKIRPSKSSTYSHDFGGKYYASMPNMPVEFLMPNTFEGIYREMKALYPSAKPEALRNMTIGAMEKRKDKISEMIGSRSIDAVKLYQEGLKQGEFDPNDIKQIYDYMRRKNFNLKLENVKKAEGGAVTGDDLIIEERPL